MSLELYLNFKKFCCYFFFWQKSLISRLGQQASTFLKILDRNAPKFLFGMEDWFCSYISVQNSVKFPVNSWAIQKKIRTSPDPTPKLVMPPKLDGYSEVVILFCSLLSGFGLHQSFLSVLKKIRRSNKTFRWDFLTVPL